MFTIILNYPVRQQLEKYNKRLTSDKADLLRRLQYCEEALKRANDCELVSVFMFNAVCSVSSGV